MLKAFKNRMPVSLKLALRDVFFARHMSLPRAPRVFVFLAADYGNIGDLAITAAQRGFLARSLPGHHIVTVPISGTRAVIRSIRRQAAPGDIATIIGGGNMGSLYPDIEELRQLVIRSFPKNRIVCFPQTIDWDETAESVRALKRIVKAYSQHPDIHVFARETITRTKLSELFSGSLNVNVSLVPDIVMSATAIALGAHDAIEPKGILRCLRDDKESALTDLQYAALDAALAGTGYEIEKTDTHAGGARLNEAHCAKLLADKLDQFRAAKLIVTDRLHGMILSALAGTPCLVLPNSNHKIRQTWLDWLRDHPRIIFVEAERFDEIPHFIKELLSAPRGALNESPVNTSQYDNLKKALVSV